MRSKYGIAMLIALAACFVMGPALAIPQFIDIADFAFQPATATVEIGVAITWTNRGESDHTVTFDTIDSGSIAPGETFSTTLEQAGTYTYHCSFHPSMTGTINAVPQQLPPVLAPRLWLPITIRSQD